MKISLGPEIVKSIDKALEYEWLERNSHGAYSFSTPLGMNIRREHGLFVVPNFDHSKKVLLLSKFEESIFIDKKLYEISTNQYSNAVFPEGYKYLEKFELYPFPRFIYKVEDRIIHKNLFLLSDKNILVIRYELKNQGSPIMLIIKPFLTARFHQTLIEQVQGINTDSYLGHHSVRWAPRPHMPQLYAFFNSGEYIEATLWYHRFHYSRDEGKYPTQEEDLLNPGFFQVTLKPYDSFDLFLSTQSIPEFEMDYEALHRRELKNRGVTKGSGTTFDEYFSDFKYTLRQSIEYLKGETYLSISAIQNNRNMREIIFSIPGVFLATNDYDNFRKVFLKITEQLNEGLLPLVYSQVSEKPYYAAADLSLWLINLGYLYLVETRDFDFFEGKIYDLFRSVIDYYQAGTTFNIYADHDHLLFVGDKNLNLSWLQVKTPGSDHIRFGKLLEINALWYNALCIMALLSKKLDRKRFANKYAKYSSVVKHSFKKVFFDPQRSCFYDWIQNDRYSEEFNINQIIPLTLPFRCVEDEIGQIVLEKIESKLLTPYGLQLRSERNGSAEGNPAEISTIMPFNILLYIQASLNYKADVSDNLEYFRPMFNLVRKGLLGYIPEFVCSGDEIRQNGIADYTTALANLVWLRHLLNRKN